MSSIWTPGGERPVNDPSGATPQEPTPTGQRPPTGFHAREDGHPGEDQDFAAQGEPSEDQMEALRQQLAEAPAEIVVSNHCFGLFELAALHLSEQPARLSEAQLAIDALGALVENLTGRLGEAEPQLREGLNSLRLAFVQIRSSTEQSS